MRRNDKQGTWEGLPTFAKWTFSDFFKLMHSFPIEGNKKTYKFQILFTLSHVFLRK